MRAVLREEKFVRMSERMFSNCGGWRCKHSGSICSCLAAGRAGPLMALSCLTPWLLGMQCTDWAPSIRALHSTLMCTGWEQGTCCRSVRATQQVSSLEGGVSCWVAVCLTVWALTLQVTRGTVDEGIHALAMRKLRLDAAVLEGITATGDARKGKGGDSAADTVQVRWRQLLMAAMCMAATCMVSFLGILYLCVCKPASIVVARCQELCCVQ